MKGSVDCVCLICYYISHIYFLQRLSEVWNVMLFWLNHILQWWSFFKSDSSSCCGMQTQLQRMQNTLNYILRLFTGTVIISSAVVMNDKPSRERIRSHIAVGKCIFRLQLRWTSVRGLGQWSIWKCVHCTGSKHKDYGLPRKKKWKRGWEVALLTLHEALENAV